MVYLYAPPGAVVNAPGWQVFPPAEWLHVPRRSGTARTRAVGKCAILFVPPFLFDSD